MRKVNLLPNAGLVGLLACVLSFAPAGVSADPTQLQNGTATFSSIINETTSPDQAVDGIFDSANGWHIATVDAFDGTNSETAVWETATDLSADTLKFTMYFLHSNPGHLLGRFRFSVTTDDRSMFADGLDTGGDVDANWVVLDNPAVQGPAGMTFTTLFDDSVLARGTTAGQGVYTVTYSTTVSGITGVRLEALEDPTLPGGNGPGLFPRNGNFFLTEMTLEAAVCVSPPANLVSWWPGDGDAMDIADGNHGMLQNGASFANGMVGQAFSFDEQDDLVSVPHNPNLNFGEGHNFTIDAWINLQNPTPGIDDSIVMKWDVQNYRVGITSNFYWLNVNRDTHRVRFSLGSGAVVYDLDSLAAIALGVWTHVVAVRDGNQGLIYINGQLDNSGPLTGGTLANGDPLAIGAVYDTASNPPVQLGHGFGGLIDELEIFSRSLTSEEIQAIFNAGSAGKCKNAQLTDLGAANVWLGLKNSDDVGTKFDLLTEVFKNGSPVGSGQLNAVPGGSSGFNNAVLRTIDLALSAPTDVQSGDTLSIRLSVRIAVGVSGHRSGTARLWFNDAAANSRFGATIGGVTSDYFLLNGFTLGAAAGPGPKRTIDVFVDRAVGGNPFKPFGTWSKTF